MSPSTSFLDFFGWFPLFFVCFGGFGTPCNPTPTTAGGAVPPRPRAVAVSGAACGHCGCAAPAPPVLRLFCSRPCLSYISTSLDARAPPSYRPRTALAPPAHRPRTARAPSCTAPHRPRSQVPRAARGQHTGVGGCAITAGDHPDPLGQGRGLQALHDHKTGPGPPLLVRKERKKV